LIALPLPTFIPRYLPPETPDEWFGHLAFAHDLLNELRPSLLVEVGTAPGDSYFGFCQSVIEHGLACVCYCALTSVGGSDQAAYNAASYGSFSHLLDRGSALNGFTADSIGLLHIRILEHESFDAWLRKVKPGGLVLINSIAKRDAGGDIWRLWEQVTGAFENRFAFHHGCGLGVLRKPGGDSLGSPLLAALFSESVETQEYVRRHYEIYSGHLEHILYRTGANKALTTTIDELKTELQAARHERMFLETELRQTQFDRSDARREVNRIQASLVDFRAASDNKEQELQQEIERLNSLLESERQINHSLTHSLSWTVTAPLRMIMEGVRSRKK
jgi:hypothetical protein